MLPRLFDTHAHLNLKEFANDWQDVAENSLAQGVFVINVGVNYLSSCRAVEIAAEYDGMWAAIGLHPENIGSSRESPDYDRCIPENVKEVDFDPEIYGRLAQTGGKKVVAIGEIGLDYLRLPKELGLAAAIKQKQESVFRGQLALARRLSLPVIIHSRMAHRELLDILKNEFIANGPVGGVVHCFTGNTAEAAQYYDLGLYFGLNGIIFKYDINDAIAKMPADRILLETDCPYLSPVKGIKRNEPKYVAAVAHRVAQIRGETAEAVCDAAAQNTRRLFKI